MANGATNSGLTAGLVSGTPQSAALTDAATEKIAAATSQARDKVLGNATDKGASIMVKFEAEDKALHAKILADAKADDREPNKYLLRWVRQSYPVSTKNWVAEGGAAKE